MNVDPVIALPRLAALESGFESSSNEQAYRIAFLRFPEVYIKIWNIERRVAALKTVEAVRAAANNESVEMAVENLRIGTASTPLPNDPFTGKPFEISCEGRIVEIKSAQIDVLPYADPETKLRYTIKLRK